VNEGRRSLMRTWKAAWCTAVIVTGVVLVGVAAAKEAPREKVTPAFSEDIVNVPGKKLVALIVDYPPGGKTPSHRHAKSAFITGYVLSGAVRSQVDEGPAKVYKAGESWTEAPGAHHVVSENASASKPAKLLAVFVVDAADAELVTLDSK
jgi:quercetin dioxygenase-like cupin family protein